MCHMNAERIPARSSKILHCNTEKILNIRLYYIYILLYIQGNNGQYLVINTRSSFAIFIHVISFPGIAGNGEVCASLYDKIVVVVFSCC